MTSSQQSTTTSSSSSSQHQSNTNQQSNIPSTNFNQATRINSNTQTTQTSGSTSSGSTSSTGSTVSTSSTNTVSGGSSSGRVSDSRSSITTVRPSSTVSSIPVNVDKNCLCYEGGNCLKCAHRFFLRNNQCISIPIECASYDIDTGVCHTCVPGYQLNLGICEPEASLVYYFNQQCFSCFPGYKLINNECVWAPNPSADLRTKNILCFAWKGNTCVECMPGTYLSSRKICELIDPFCLSFDYNREICNSCQPGYAWTNGRCYPRQ